MTLQQLVSIKQWHLSHPQEHPVEHQMWDGMLTSWVFGWTGLPAAWFLNSLAVMSLCLSLLLLPGLLCGCAAGCTEGAGCAATG